MNHQTDRTKLKRFQNRIRARKGLIGCGTEFSIALLSNGKLVYAGSNRWGQEEACSWSEVTSLSCGRDHIVALLEDGSVRFTGRCTVERDQTDVISCARRVAVGARHMAVLLSNGRTTVIGDNRYGQCNTVDWPSVTDVVCGNTFTAGLTELGQVVIVGGTRTIRYIVRQWTNVAGIFTDFAGKALYAITAEGKLCSTARLPRQVQEWKNLVFVSGNDKQIWAVTATGQLLSTDSAISHMNASKYYISCAVSDTHVIALSRDGQVISVGGNDFGQCNTARFGTLFTGFEEFSADRQAKIARMESDERVYQVRLIEALRYRKHIVCGERLTACINADGHVLTSVDLPESRQWSQVRDIACGNAHLLARHESGRVSAAGNDVDGCTAVSEWQNVKSIAARKYHSIGLREDGAVLFCGRNDKGQGDVGEWQNIRQIYASDDYTVGVTYDGNVLIAGTPPFDPALIDDRWKNPIDVVAAQTHLVCLYANGLVNCTAYMPDGDKAVSPTSEWKNVRSISAGRNFTVGLCYGGRVLSAGKNHYGQCNTADWKQVIDIGCGNDCVVALTADGRILATGHQRTESDTDCPHSPETNRWKDIIAFRCGPDHTVAMTRSGQILSCGLDEDKQCSATAHFTLFRDARQLYGYGQYGRQLEMEIQANRSSSESASEVEPQERRFADRVEAAHVLRGSFAVGMAHSLCLNHEGRILAEGANDCGQCDIASFRSALWVAAGPYRSAAILTDGHIVFAGRNSDGQGDTRVLNGELKAAGAEADYAWKRVSCGYSHTAALRSDGRVFAIGANPDGRCDTRQWRDITDVSCGIRHTVARKSNGTCAATGDNHYGQCDVSRWKNVVMVAAGEFHTVALTADRRVLAAGDNRRGQCEVDDLRDVIAIACLPEATLCVGADGRVTVRGGSGVLNSAVEALSDVVGIDACEHRIAAMTATGELILIPKK